MHTTWRELTHGQDYEMRGRNWTHAGKHSWLSSWFAWTQSPAQLAVQFRQNYWRQPSILSRLPVLKKNLIMCLRHCILMDKMRRYWVSGNTTNVYISYLNDRRSTSIATTNIPATITTTASTTTTITTTASVCSCRNYLELLLWQDPLTFVCWLRCFRDLCARS